MHTYAQVDNHTSTTTLTIRRFSTIDPRPLDWLWKPFIPRGRLTLLAGDPGSGKTTLALELAARLSRGEPFPQSPPSATARGDVPSNAQRPANPSEPPHSEFTDSLILNSIPSPQSTLLLSPDDNPADTLRPKLERLGANLELVHTLPDFHSLIPARTANREIPPPTPLELLDEALDIIPNVGLLIIDPITHYLGLTDRAQHPDPGAPSHAYRSTLRHLSRIAENHNIAILLTTRLTKKIPDSKPGASPIDTPILHRTLGSLAFAATARSVLLLLPLPNIPARPQSPGIESLGTSPASPVIPTQIENRKSKIENPPTHLLASLKSNLTDPPAPLPLTISDTITWHTEPLPDLLLSPNPATKDFALQAATAWLETALANGPQSAVELTSQAKDNAIAEKTLSRAKGLLGIVSVKQDWTTRWYWRLPHDTRPAPQAAPYEIEMAKCLKVDHLLEEQQVFDSLIDHLAEKPRPRRKKPDHLLGKTAKRPRRKTKE